MEFENLSNFIKIVIKKRGRFKDVRNDFICMKFKIILYNKKVYKEEEKKRGKKLFYLELFKKNIGNVMNKFKGVKEMRVQVLKLIISFKSDKLGGGIEKCLKSSLNKEFMIKRKNVIKKSLEFFFGLLKKRK